MNVNPFFLFFFMNANLVLLEIDNDYRIKQLASAVTLKTGEVTECYAATKYQIMYKETKCPLIYIFIIYDIDWLPVIGEVTTIQLRYPDGERSSRNYQDSITGIIVNHATLNTPVSIFYIYEFRGRAALISNRCHN